MKMEREQRRVIVCGSADCRTDVESVCSLVAKNSILAARFQGVDAENAENADALINAGFRCDDILVLLLGDRYGSAVSEGKSLTERLFDGAGDVNLKRLVFVKTTDAASERQKAFAKKIDCLLVRKRYVTTDDAVKSVFTSLGCVMLDQDKEEMSVAVENNLNDAVDSPAKPAKPSLGTALMGTLASLAAVVTMPTCLLAGAVAPVAKAFSDGDLPDPDEKEQFEKEHAKDVLEAARVTHDNLRERVDPHGYGKTFTFKAKLDDIDTERLRARIEPELRCLERLSGEKVSIMDFLILRNYADSEGRIYDVTLLLYGKTAFQSLPNEKEGLCDSNRQVLDQLSRIESGIERIDGGMSKVVKNYMPKEKKNNHLSKKTLQDVRELWEREKKSPSHYKLAKGRKVSKQDVYDLYKDKLADNGVMTYKDFLKAIDNGRKPSAKRGK